MIGIAEIQVLLPDIIVAVTVVILMMVIAFRRDHKLTVVISVAGLALAAASLLLFIPGLPKQATSLLILDTYSYFYKGLILAATAAVCVLSYGYLEKHDMAREEYYLLLLLAALGAMILVASCHFVSLLLGVEILSVSLYALVAYRRASEKSIEAGIKYLVLAAVSSAFLIFGMALLYFERGTMEFSKLAVQNMDAGSPAFISGTVLVICGLGFKLAAVPFHMWTPDVYEGAPPPVAAFVATVSKGAVFALLVRYFGRQDMEMNQSLFYVFTAVAVASMVIGNLLALLQGNVKRILAYSSSAHTGYLLTAFLAGGDFAVTAVAFYLSAYFITTLGAFGTITLLSQREGDADQMEQYRSLAWGKPWVAGVFTVMLFSLAGIPLTAGFMAKFYLLAAGVKSALWFPVLVLILSSAAGLFYYLRIILVLFSRKEAGTAHWPLHAAAVSRSGSMVLAILTLLIIWLGTYPGPFIGMVEKTTDFMK